MKALLVLDDKEKLNLLKEKLNNEGFDTICYQWLMKALDNLEEISPHIVIISAEDYPRHWKIFVQHIKSQNFDHVTKVFLVAKNLNSDELDKIQILGIDDIIYDIEEDYYKISNGLKHKKIIHSLNQSMNSIADDSIQENVETLDEITDEKSFTTEDSINNEVIQTEEIIVEKPSQINKDLSSSEKTFETKSIEKNVLPLQNPQKKKIVTSCTFSLVNPASGKVIMGKVRKYKYPTILFIPNNSEEIKNLRFGQIFENCNLKQIVDSKELSSNHRCQIRGITDNQIEFCLLR